MDHPETSEEQPMLGEMAKKEDHSQGHGTHNSSIAETKMPHVLSEYHAHMAANSRINKRRTVMTSNLNVPVTPASKRAGRHSVCLK